MVRWFSPKRPSPIGVDIGSRSIKLLQFNADRSQVLDAVRWDLPANGERVLAPRERDRQLSEAIERAREKRNFRGREAVLCLGARDLFVQNIRVSRMPGSDLAKVVQQEAAGRIPFSAAEAEIRYLDAADVRQGDVTKREVILLACHRPVLDRMLEVVHNAGLRPAAIDVEPAALLRCYTRQFRRDEDQQQRTLFAHVGLSNTMVVIARGADTLFIKYIDVGGRHMDEAVARNLSMDLPGAAALRRHNGDRRADQQDPEVVRSLAESVRPVIDRLANEVSLGIRYHSVTFRGQPIGRMVLGGGEASPLLADALGARLDMKCELGDPLRSYEKAAVAGHKGQWDVAAGLALRELA
ncbi:MAG: pilus assembly protein PilM [Pirellulales bacterium]